MQKHELDKAISDIVRVLPASRAMQVLDFARWLQTQPGISSTDEQALVALEQEEQAWMRAYEARSTEFRELARQALKDLAEGDTYLMTVAEGRLEAR